MWRSCFFGLGVALGMALSGPAQAVIYEIRVEGTLVSQLNPGTDPNLAIGDKIVVTARFDETLSEKWGDLGYYQAGFYRANLPDCCSGVAVGTNGPEFFRIDGPGMTWRASDHENDFEEFFIGDRPPLAEIWGFPGIAFDESHVLGLAGFLYPAGSSVRPQIELGSAFGSGFIAQFIDEDGVFHDESKFQPSVFSPFFEITAPNGSYGNEYPTPGFNGIWDFAGSSVKIMGVPEPASWAMMIAGLGLVGAALRRRRLDAPRGDVTA